MDPNDVERGVSKLELNTISNSNDGGKYPEQGGQATQASPECDSQLAEPGSPSTAASGTSLKHPTRLTLPLPLPRLQGTTFYAPQLQWLSGLARWLYCLAGTRWERACRCGW